MNRVPEVLKLLKALQFEMASAWHSMWEGNAAGDPSAEIRAWWLVNPNYAAEDTTCPGRPLGRAFSESSFLQVPSVNRSVNCIQRYIATSRARRGADRSRQGYRLCQSRPQSNAGAQDQGAH